MSLIILFQAGCAGDVKTMALGDVRRALQLEGYGIGAALVSAGLSAAAFIQISQSPRRVPQAITFALFLFVCLWIAGMEMETQGIQSCF